MTLNPVFEALASISFSTSKRKLIYILLTVKPLRNMKIIKSFNKAIFARKRDLLPCWVLFKLRCCAFEIAWYGG